MAENTTVGFSFLSGFLRLMVFTLIGILIAIPVCIVCDIFGVFDALGLHF